MLWLKADDGSLEAVSWLAALNREGALPTVLPAGQRPPSGAVSGSLRCVQAAAPVVANVSSNATSWSLTGPAAPVPGVALGDMLANLSLGRAVVNVYTANFPQPLQPMGCCNNAEARNPAPSPLASPPASLRFHVLSGHDVAARLGRCSAHHEALPPVFKRAASLALTRAFT